MGYYSAIFRLIFFLWFAVIFIVAGIKPVYAEWVCPYTKSWTGGYVTNTSDICQLPKLIDNTCENSSVWTKTGQNCCNQKFGWTCRDGSVTPHLDTNDSTYIYSCCYEITPTPIPPTPTSIPPTSSPPTPTPTPICGGSGEICCSPNNSCDPSLICNTNITPNRCEVIPTTAPTPILNVCDKDSYTSCNSANDMGSSSTKTNMCGNPQRYFISVPSGQECKLTWSLTGLTADYDLYASWASGISACINNDWDCASQNASTNNENCTSNYLPTGGYYAWAKLYGGVGTYNIKGERTCRTPIPSSCVVTTSPIKYDLAKGDKGAITASVTGLPAGRTISQMRFGAYNTSIATVNPTSDSDSTYETTVTAVAGGTTAVWATADLDNGDTTTCQTPGDKDTDINVSGPTSAPVTPTEIPTPTPCSGGDTYACSGECSYPTSPGCGSTCTVTYYCDTTCTQAGTFGGPWCSTSDYCSSADPNGYHSSGCVKPNGQIDLPGCPKGIKAYIATCTSKGLCSMGYRRYRYVCGGLQDSSCVSTGVCPAPTVGPPTSTPTPTPGSYFISGKIFNDTNGDKKSNGDSNYTNSIVTITISPTVGSYSNPGTGFYSFTGLPAGQYTITFSGLPDGSTFTYPPSSIIVTVGSPGCSVSPTSEASCSSGSISNLNAGVTTNSSSWFQSIGSDLRWDSGFINTIPSGKYASLLGTGGMPGIIFSGASTLGQPTQASAAPFNWQVGSFSNPDVFTHTHNLIPSSYRFLLETAQSSGITPTTIANVDSSLTHGIYKTDGNLTINAPVTFGSGNFIILVNGNLTINQTIKVPVGSTAIFSAKGDITVSQNVGESNPASAVSNIEGLYSADEDFIADQVDPCPSGIHNRLNIAGTVVANAGRTGGTFVNKRSLCANNSSSPSVSFIERPDFILNYPTLTQQTTRAWQELAP